MFSPTGPVIWPFKFLIPVVGVLLLLQGVVEVVRCIRCIRTGAWPERLSDVEELEQQILAAAAARDPEELAREIARNRPAFPARRAGDEQTGRWTDDMTDGALGLTQLFLFLFFIMLGFPIAFTLMAMGLFFGYLGMQERIFDLLVQRTYAVMSNDVLISVPLFVLMGYVIERANILDRLFRSLQMASGNIPGSLAVATLATCALFATATGIVGAVVTLMGLLAFPAMLRAGYDVKLAAGRDLRGRVPGHPDPAIDHADPVRRDRRRLGRAALCRGLHPGRHAGGAVHPVCDRHRHREAIGRAAPAARRGERALRHDPAVAASRPSCRSRH